MSGAELITAVCFLFHSRGSLGRGVPQELSNPDPVKRINIHFSTLFNSLVPRAFLREKRGDEVACLSAFLI